MCLKLLRSFKITMGICLVGTTLKSTIEAIVIAHLNGMVERSEATSRVPTHELRWVSMHLAKSTAEVPIAAILLAVPIKSYRRFPPCPSTTPRSPLRHPTFTFRRNVPRNLVPPQRLRRRFPDGTRVGSALFLGSGNWIARSGLGLETSNLQLSASSPVPKNARLPVYRGALERPRGSRPVSCAGRPPSRACSGRKLRHF